MPDPFADLGFAADDGLDFHAEDAAGQVVGGVTNLGTIDIVAGQDAPGPREGATGDEVVIQASRALHHHNPRVRAEAERVMGVASPEARSVGSDISGEAPIRNFISGASFGFDDELAGAARALVGGDYNAGRNEWNARRERANTQADASDDAVTRYAPAVAGAGGALATAAIPLGGVSRALGVTSGIGRAALEGAALGGLSAAGNAEEGTRLESAAQGAALAGLGGAGIGALSRGLGGMAGGAASRARGAAQSVADRARIRAVGGRMGDIANVEATFPGGVSGFADTLRREGATSTLAGPSRMRELVEQMRERGGQGIQQALAAAEQEAVTANPIALAREIHGSAVAPAQASSVPQVRRAAGDLQRLVDNVAGDYPEGLGIRDLQRLKGDLRSGARFETARQSPAIEGMRDAYSAVNRTMENAIDEAGSRIGDETLRGRYIDSKRAFGAGERASEWGEREANRAASNRQLSPSDQGAAALAMLTTGNPMAAIPATIANKFLRGREHNIVASGAEVLSRVLQTRPQALGQNGVILQRLAAERGGEAAAAANFVMQRTDPVHRANLAALEGEPLEEEPIEDQEELAYGH